jgi:hypothetical protein
MKKPCFIYLIATKTKTGKAGRPVKIGIAENPEKRLRSISTASSKALGLYEKWWCPSRYIARTMEREIHVLMDRDRLHGEWFNLGPGFAWQLIEGSIIKKMMDHGTTPEQIDAKSPFGFFARGDHLV